MPVRVGLASLIAQYLDLPGELPRIPFPGPEPFPQVRPFLKSAEALCQSA